MSHLRRSSLILGCVIALIHIMSFFFVAWLLQSHGASMEAMVAKMDQVEYLQLADTMFSAHRFALSPDAPAEIFRTPGYPTFVAMTYLASSHWYWAPFVASGILLGLIASIVALLGMEMGLTVGISLLAGALIGLSSGSFLLSMTATGSDILYTFVYACAALVALRLRHDTYRPLAIGLLLGMATLVRPIGILASLPLLFGSGLIFALNGRAYLRSASVALAAWILILTPWYVRNHQVAGVALLSTVSTFNITYYNIPMNEAFWHRASEADTRLAILHIVGTTTPEALRSTEFLPVMESYDHTYLRSHIIDYGIFHISRTVPFFFMSGFNVIHAVLAHEAPALRSSLFPTESDNLTRHITSHEWGAALHALGAYWLTTLERLSWFVAILLAFAAPFFARGRNRRILLVFAAIIVANIILISPVTQARYRFPAEPYIWVAAVYTGVTLWNRYRDRTA
jgi:hypothetical protein